MKTITTLEELDASLATCEAARSISDDALRAAFTGFQMEYGTDLPADPFSPEYRGIQMALFERLSARSYDPRNEVTSFDVAAADRRPFPFFTGSPSTAGHFTMCLGFMLQKLELAPGARVVEFGPGWGNSTMAMAMLGMDVTAVDIEPNFCELLRRRAARQEVALTVVNADFMWAETVREPFDAAMFFDCFHHCADHMRLLRALGSAVRPGGRVYFAGEPIHPEFPIPWGVRLDGEALMAVRGYGWMELGFQDSYFAEALARTGWTGIKHSMPNFPAASVWEAQRTSEIELATPATSAPPPQHAPLLQATPAPDPLKLELDAIYRSTSWRVTAPLRAVGRLLRPQA